MGTFNPAFRRRTKCVLRKIRLDFCTVSKTHLFVFQESNVRCVARSVFLCHAEIGLLKATNIRLIPVPTLMVLRCLLEFVGNTVSAVII